jgi:hypothetical protein
VTITRRDNAPAADAQLRICGLVLTHHPGMTTQGSQSSDGHGNLSAVLEARRRKPCPPFKGTDRGAMRLCGISPRRGN